MPDEPVADDTNPLVLTVKFWVPRAYVDDGALEGIEAGYVDLLQACFACLMQQSGYPLVVESVSPYSTETLQLSLCLGKLGLTC